MGLLLGTIAGQIVVCQQFFGNKRGKFELLYLKFTRKNEMNRAISNLVGNTRYFAQLLAEFGEISWSKGEKYQAILNNEPELDDSIKFPLLYKLGILSKKDRSYQKAISYFNMCLEAKPNDLLLNYIQGQCFEREGNGDFAIESYQKASCEGAMLSKNLKQYIDDQIKRVEIKGPSKKPPNPGLMHTGVK
ncbi:MAG: hypothetical protein GY699_08865 [Desulfobacteraceae bacterium]|nr:hypothetical protein [Desulfobacteraceae bacterium]